MIGGPSYGVSSSSGHRQLLPPYDAARLEWEVAWWGNDEGLGLGRWGEQPSVRAVGQSGGPGGGFRVCGFWVEAAPWPTVIEGRSQVGAA